MLFIKPENNQSIWIPKHNKVFTDKLKLVLEHTLTHKTTEFNDLTDHDVNSGYFLFYGLDFRNLDSGEYEYKLFDGDGWQKENGMLQVMTKLSEPISYKHNNQTIIYKHN